MVQEAIEQGRSQGSVIVEDLGPVFKGAIGGDNDGALFVALADDLEQQVGAGLIDRQVSQFVNLCGAPHNLIYVECSLMLRTICKDK